MEEHKERQISLLVRRQLLVAYARGLAGKAERINASLGEASGLDVLVCQWRLAWCQHGLKRSIRELEGLVGLSGLGAEELLEVADFLLRAGLGQDGIVYAVRVKDSQLRVSADTLALAEMTLGRIRAAEGKFGDADWHFRSVIGQFEATPELVSLAVQARVHRAYADFLRGTRSAPWAADHERKAMVIEAELGAAGIRTDQGVY